MTININSQTEIWGPSTAAPAKLAFTQSHLQDIPYSPFAKTDRLARPADWYASTSTTSDQPGANPQGQQDGRHGGTQRNNNQRGSTLLDQQAASSAFAYIHESEDSFSVVDRQTAVPIVRTGFSGGVGGSGGGQNSKTWPNSGNSSGGSGKQASGAWGKTRPAFGNSNPSSGSTNTNSGSGGYGNKSGPGKIRFGWSGAEKTVKGRETAVRVGADWVFVEEYQLSAFSKLSTLAPSGDDGVKDLRTCGSAGVYARSFDRISQRAPVVLSSAPIHDDESSKVLPLVKEDAVMQEFADKTKNSDIVMASGAVLAALMTAPRSVNGWDVIINRRTRSDGVRIVEFEQRRGGALEQVTVNETATAHEFMNENKEGPNSPASLAVEATLVNEKFQKLAIDSKQPAVHFSEPVNQKACKYRKWILRKSGSDEGSEGEKGLVLISRSEIDATSGPTTLSLNTLMEYHRIDPATNQLQSKSTPDWKQKIDSQRGAILANCIKNNSYKLARWTMESVLGRIDQMKLAFVSRKFATNASGGHLIVGTQFYRPLEFATNQLGVDMEQAWGIVRGVAEIFLQREEDGVYALIKDPSYPKIKMYRVPENGQIPGYMNDQEQQEEAVAVEDEETEK
eukprot:Partr_v1_DN27003_c0_g1_i2_m29188 putative Component of the eukaryotic translation initiation factor 3 (eIF-3) complex, which is involved in protein synthesis and, together with other initiation factors, stimulates binding of mRNA and methionyl-tRNAi to the 40S ribosome (By similarity)